MNNISSVEIAKILEPISAELKLRTKENVLLNENNALLKRQNQMLLRDIQEKTEDIQSLSSKVQTLISENSKKTVDAAREESVHISYIAMRERLIKICVDYGIPVPEQELGMDIFNIENTAVYQELKRKYEDTLRQMETFPAIKGNQEAEEELANLREQLEAFSKNCEELEGERDKAQAELSEVKGQLEELSKQLEEVKNTDGEQTETDSEHIAELEGRIAELEQTLAAKEKELEDAIGATNNFSSEEELNSLKDSLAANEAEFAKAQNDIFKLNEEVEALSEEIGKKNQQLEEYAGMSEYVERLENCVRSARELMPKYQEAVQTAYDKDLVIKNIKTAANRFADETAKLTAELEALKTEQRASAVQAYYDPSTVFPVITNITSFNAGHLVVFKQRGENPNIVALVTYFAMQLLQELQNTGVVPFFLFVDNNIPQHIGEYLSCNIPVEERKIPENATAFGYHMAVTASRDISDIQSRFRIMSDRVLVIIDRYCSEKCFVSETRPDMSLFDIVGSTEAYITKELVQKRGIPNPPYVVNPETTILTYDITQTGEAEGEKKTPYMFSFDDCGMGWKTLARASHVIEKEQIKPIDERFMFPILKLILDDVKQ